MKTLQKSQFQIIDEKISSQLVVISLEMLIEEPVADLETIILEKELAQLGVKPSNGVLAIHEKKKEASESIKRLHAIVEACTSVGIKVITFDTLLDVAKDHSLVVGLLSWYEREIPIDNQKEYLKNLKYLQGKRLVDNTYNSISAEIVFSDSRETLGCGFILASKADFEENLTEINGELFKLSTEEELLDQVKRERAIRKAQLEDPVIVYPLRNTPGLLAILTAWDRVALDPRIFNTVKA